MADSASAQPGQPAARAARPALSAIQALVLATGAVSAVGGAALVVQARTWQPLLFMGAMALASAVLVAFIGSAFGQRHASGQWSDKSVAWAVALMVATAFGGIFAVGLAERAVFFGSGKVAPTFLTEHIQDGERFDVDDYRLARLLCQNLKSPMFVRQHETRVTMRCGEFYPRTYSISVPAAAFFEAQAQAANDRPGTPIVIRPRP